MLGIAMPGHFLIKPNFPDAGIFVDPFYQGEILFTQDCEERLSQVYQKPMSLQPHFLAPVSQKQIIQRMLTNLKLIYLQRQELEKALKFISAILMVAPSNHQEIRDRGLIYYQLGEFTQARYDLENYLNLAHDAQDLNKIQHLLNQIKSF
jgi:regulator of sirC expression with transglutaminase-like and TPR domain